MLDYRSVVLGLAPARSEKSFIDKHLPRLKSARLIRFTSSPKSPKLRQKILSPALNLQQSFHIGCANGKRSIISSTSSCMVRYALSSQLVTFHIGWFQQIIWIFKSWKMLWGPNAWKTIFSSIRHFYFNWKTPKIYK